MTPEDVQEKINYCEYQINEAKRLTDELIKHKEECERTRVGFQRWQDGVNNAHNNSISAVNQIESIEGVKCISSISNILRDVLQGEERNNTIASIETTNNNISISISIYQDSINESRDITAGLEEVHGQLQLLLKKTLLAKAAVQSAEAKAKESPTESFIKIIGPSANSSNWSWHEGDQSFLLCCSMLNSLVSRRENLESAKNIRTF